MSFYYSCIVPVHTDSCKKLKSCVDRHDAEDEI